MACGIKWMETRDWDTQVRGIIHIHASRTTRGVEDVAFFADRDVRQAMEDALKLRAPAWRDLLPYGALVAVGVLAQSIPAEAALAMAPDQAPFGNFSPGRFAHIYQDLRPLVPLPLRGSQGFFRAQLPAPPVKQ
jgi:hypothetical protein